MVSQESVAIKIMLLFNQPIGCQKITCAWFQGKSLGSNDKFEVQYQTRH